MTGEKFPACHSQDSKSSSFLVSRVPKPKPSLPKPSKKGKYPIPKGHSFYASAKHAEYILKDLAKAEYFYLQAILTNDREESAVKDLASLLHQQGRTRNACEILEKFSNLVKSSPQKLNNLYSSLKKHLENKVKLPKVLKIVGFLSKPTKTEVLKQFSNSNRIENVQIEERSALVYFPSHSSARKTVESFEAWGKLQVFWLGIEEEVLAEIRSKERISIRPLDFHFRVFCKDPGTPSLCLAIDNFEYLSCNEKVEFKDHEVLGAGLASVL